MTNTNATNLVELFSNFTSRRKLRVPTAAKLAGEELLAEIERLANIYHVQLIPTRCTSLQEAIMPFFEEHGNYLEHLPCLYQAVKNAMV